MVIIKDLKFKLIQKRNEIISALKRKLLTNVHNKLSLLKVRYDEILNELPQRSLNVEHLKSITDFIPSIDGKLFELNVEIKNVLSDFLIIDSFFIVLPENIFTLKWNTLQMPQIINKHADAILESRENEIERFRKLQTSDEIVFLEKMQTIPVFVNGNLKKYSLKDLASATSNTGKVRNLSKFLKGRITNYFFQN